MDVWCGDVCVYLIYYATNGDIDEKVFHNFRFQLANNKCIGRKALLSNGAFVGRI